MFKTAKSVKAVLRTFSISAENRNPHYTEIQRADDALWAIAMGLAAWQREQRLVNGRNGRISDYLRQHSETITKALATLEAHCSEINRPALDQLRKLQIADDDFLAEALEQAEQLLQGEDWTAEALAQVEAVFA